MSSAASGITLRDVSVRFGANPAVLSGIDLTIEQGEFVAFVGASGCGKTTLMNVISGLVKPSGGQAVVNGHAPSAGNAYVLARDALLPWRTVRSNVEYALQLCCKPRAARSGIAREYLSKVGLLAFEDRYPARLSQGMKQRVALARAFAVNRPIYLLDEPFSALDPQTKLVLHEQLLALWEGSRTTVVFVTHDIAEAVTLADRVIVMGTKGRGVVEEIRVGLERPRSAADLQDDEEFLHIHRRASSALRAGMS